MLVSKLRQLGFKGAIATCAVGGALIAVSCGDSSSEGSAELPPGQVPIQSGAEAAERSEPEVTVPDIPPPKKLVIEDLIKGSGAKAELGDLVTVLYVVRRWDGGLFSNSWTYSPRPRFVLGRESNPDGFYDSIPGMRAGGRRKVLMPASRYYSPTGARPPLKRRDNLVFIIDLLKVREGPPS